MKISQPPSEIWKNAARIIESKKDSKNVETEKIVKETRNKIKEALKQSILPNSPIKISTIFKMHSDQKFLKNIFFDTESTISQRLDKVKVPSFFPKERMRLFDTMDIYGKMPCDTLFFVFFYEQKSMRQYFAAKELKSQAWRFSIKYKTWFQRRSKPRIFTESHEVGSYIYFEAECFWHFLFIDDYLFEYEDLENYDI